MDTNLDGLPGVSNTPAQNTQQKPMRVLVDWVSCSFYSEKNFDEISQLFGLYEMEIQGECKRVEFSSDDYSRYRQQGYKEVYKYGSMEFHYDPEHCKYLVSFSGQGCREFDVISPLDYEQLFSMLIHYFNATFNRIDIAIDDFKSIYKVNTIRKAINNGQAKTKVTKWGSNTEGIIQKPGELTMDNFYIGKLSSRYSINIYDKKLERKNKMDNLKEGQLLLDNPNVLTWTRTEIRLKEGYATRFAREIALNESGKPIGLLAKEFLNQSICFLKRKVKDGNKSRLSQDVSNYAHWWRKFLGDVGKLNLSQQKSDKTVVNTVKWFNKQVAPSFAVLNELSPNSLNLVIHALTVMGKKRLSDEHKMMIKVAKDSDLDILDVLKQYVDEDTYQNLMDMDRKMKSKKKVVVMDQYQKEDKKEKLLDVYWSQVIEQQKKTHSN